MSAKRNQGRIATGVSWKITRLSEWTGLDDPQCENPVIAAPAHPLRMGQIIANTIEQLLMSIHRVVIYNQSGFADNGIYQHYEKGEGWTGYDLLLVGGPQVTGLAVDQGTSITPLALVYNTGDVDLLEQLPGKPFDAQLNEEDLTRLMQEAHSIIQDYHVTLRDQFKSRPAGKPLLPQSQPV